MMGMFRTDICWNCCGEDCMHYDWCPYLQRTQTITTSSTAGSTVWADTDGRTGPFLYDPDAPEVKPKNKQPFYRGLRKYQRK